MSLLFVGYTILIFLKPELNGTKAYEETSIDEKSVVHSHFNELPLSYKFAVNVIYKERPHKLPTMSKSPALKTQVGNN